MPNETGRQLPLFHIFEVDDRIRSNLSLSDLKRRTDRIFTKLNPQFEVPYSRIGRPSVLPERLLKVLLLMALNSIHSER